jgi:two-component system response regulator HydG
MSDIERQFITETLKATGGNREEAARILDIGERTLYRKIKEYGITLKNQNSESECDV